MIGRLIEFCATHRALVFIVTAFVIVGSLVAVRSVPLDAIPDLSDPQVIIFTEWMGRSPDLVEDQITYPIASSLLAAPRVEAVRGQSMFGMSFIYVIFKEGTNLYWARSRVLEYMNTIRSRLPQDVNPALGPDATSVGWVFQYALVDRSGRHDLADLRTFQDFNLRYALASVPGSPRWRRWAATSASTRSRWTRPGSMPTACRSATSSGPSGAATPTWAGACSRCRGASTSCAAVAT